MVLCHLQTVTVLFLHFQFGLLLFLLSCLIAVARTSSTVLNKSGPCLVLDIRGNAFSFSLLSMMLSVGLSYMAFIMLRYVPSRYVLESFYHTWMLNFVKSFFYIYWTDHMIFVLEFVHLQVLKKSLHPWDKYHLIMVYNPFNVLLDSVC